MKSPGCSFVALAAILLPAATAQTTWHVQAGAAPPGSGSAASPFPGIQAGIDAASGGDLVLVGPGTYLENLDYHGKAIEVAGTAGAEATIIDADDAGLGVRFSTGEGRDSVLRGFTIADGQGGFPGSQTGLGGGNIGCLDASPAIIDCVLLSGFGSNGGGGIFCRRGGPLVSGCTFSGNWGYHQGGGIRAVSVYGLVVANCSFLGNGATCSGGAISVSGSARIEDSYFGSAFVEDCGGASLDVGGVFSPPGRVEIHRCRFENAYSGNVGGAAWVGSHSSARFVDCVFHENRATYHGGATYASSSGAASFEECVFIGNVAHIGGAVYGAGTFVNCTLANNTADWFPGGGAFFGRGSFVHCTISGNSGTAQGGAIAQQGQVQLVNCIHWGNLPPAVPSGVVASWSDIEGGWPGIGNIAFDPLFANPQEGDFHIQTASPCRNAGIGAVVGLPRWDFEGHPRSWDSGPDMGADEWVVRRVGSEGDLILVSEVNGRWPLAGTKTALPGEVLDLGVYSPAGTLTGAVPYLAASLHPNGAGPLPNPLVPGLWINAHTFVILVDGPATFPAGLPAFGIQLDSVLAPALSGTTVRLQAAALLPGGFVLTDAHDIVVL